ncbi:MAG: autotransporter outer membrane beta-barrel domain-containing protein, partial [Candidatus Gastranaerophilales bacterium]|nr:autotransporter outer membrane beta-barrel domain-containing protein [Candidatus Gastranaerophilales bacterium]
TPPPPPPPTPNPPASHRSTIDIANSNIDTLQISNVVLNSDVNLAIDLDLSTLTTDSFSGTSFSGNGTINITTVNAYNAASSCIVDSIKIHLSDLTGIDSAYLTSVDQTLPSILTPIRYLTGEISDNYLIYAPSGNSYKDFNPAVMASPVAAQLGGYLTQLNSYDEAFRNMDMYMLMTKKERQALKSRNKYAASDGNLVFDPTNTPYDNTALWARPYTTFENVPLKNGPKVSNVAYGSFFGGESEILDLGHGWDGTYGIYAGYNGSHQAYDGVSIYQNGGTLGAIGMVYKGDFFTGLTANVGANAGRASTMYGYDDFTLLMAGIASKTGYNFEFADGKFILQPNFLMSYSFVNTFDYTNAAGVHINSDPLHAIQLEPGLKFIGNLKNGWQPYMGVSVVWNIMDKTKFRANDVSLPELSVKPFVKYGIGIRKTWGERFTGFFQTYITNGGRNGVGLQAGFRWALGKDYSRQTKANGKLPELPKTTIALKNVKKSQ